MHCPVVNFLILLLRSGDGYGYIISGENRRKVTQKCCVIFLHLFLSLKLSQN